MKLLKKFMTQLILLGIICVIAICGYIKTAVVNVDTVTDVSRTVILDAGHGGLTNTID